MQLSPVPEPVEKESVALPNEAEKFTTVQPSSPVCVILDDDSSPTPSVEKKVVRQISEKKSHEPEKSTSKQVKRSRDSDPNPPKDKPDEHSESKRKRLTDGIPLFTEKNQLYIQSSREFEEEHIR